MLNEELSELLSADFISGGLLGTAFGALLGSFVTHRMTRDSARWDRIRNARRRLRELIDRAEAEDGLHAFSVHQEFSPEIFELKHSIPDDLRWWKRGKFTKACDAFLNIPGCDLQPNIVPMPIGVPRSKEAKERDEQELQRPVKLLTDAMRTILKTT